MMFTIFKPDNVVILDGIADEGFDLAWLPANFRAMHWDGNKGYVELMDATNIPIDSVRPYQAILDKMTEKKRIVVGRKTDPYFEMPSEEVIAIKLAKINDEREIRANGGVEVNGRWFNTDLGSRIKYLTMWADLPFDFIPDYVLKENGHNVEWKTMDNTYIPMTVGLLGQIIAAFKKLDQDLFLVADQHKKEVRSNPAHDFTSGWPKRFTKGR